MVKNLLLVVLTVVFWVGCSLEKPAPTANKSAVVVKVTPAPVQDKPVLTAEQVARNEAITLAVKIVRLAHQGGTNKDLPKWVADQYRAYEERDYTRQHTAFQRSVGWGTGSYKGNRFDWFAFTNTDAYLQFNFSAKIFAEDLGKLIGGRKDSYGRHRDAEFPGSDWFMPGTGTWIGDTHDWADTNCVRPEYGLCDTGTALEKSVADINKDLPGLNLVIKGKFPW